MNTREDKAKTSHQSGLNCAQSVLTAYTEDLNFDKNLALSISCGFGGGMGRLQETCGAVTGAFMVLSIYNCKKYTNNMNRKDKTYSMVQKFAEIFKSIHGATDCKSLIKVDLKTEEGNRFAKENKLFDTVCEKCIIDAVKIVDKLIEI